MSRERLIETFNTHRMSAAVIKAVATARDVELAEVMRAVRRAAEQPHSTAQHLIIYGERGSGKSFLLRLVEIEIERLAQEESLPIVAALLPEEQYNIRSVPQLIQAIAAKVRGEHWVFTMDFRPLDEAWEAAVAELDTALDQRFGQNLGRAVAMVENFDTLTRQIFGSGAAVQKKSAGAKAIEQNAAEQLLRKLMNRKDSRLMWIASATGTVDQDYERPLFQAFKAVDLKIWTSDDCIAYFNRRRDLDQQANLSLPEEARARAIAEFIGGNPRLAQLLGEVLATPDARSIANTLDALSDHLADYYRHRLDDLPPQSAALLDALIRKGEPCTQTKLAERVGASSQAQIADAFRYLQTSRLLAAVADKLGAGTLYRLRDRLFVHFYRRRYGDQASGLAPIVELLESFFTQREREEQARRHLEMGEWADARLYASSNLFMCLSSEGFCWYRDDAVIGTPPELFQLAGLSTDAAIETQTELKLHPELSIKRWRDAAKQANLGLNRTAALLLEAIALSRYKMDDQAEKVLEEALGKAEADRDKDSQILALDSLVNFVFNRRKDRNKTLELTRQIGELAGQAQNDIVQALAICNKAWILAIDGDDYLKAISALDEAAVLAEKANSQRLQARIFRIKAYSLNQLKCYKETISAAKQAADLAAAVKVVHYQIEALGFMSFALSILGEHETAEAIWSQIGQLVNGIGDKQQQSCPLWYQLSILCELKYLDTKLAGKTGDLNTQAWAISPTGYALKNLRQEIEFAIAYKEEARRNAQIGNINKQIFFLLKRALSLFLLEQYEPAIESAQTACELAITTKDASQQAEALYLKGWSLAKLGRMDEASNAFDAAFSIAKSLGQPQELVAILKGQSNSLRQKKPEQTLFFAREVLTEMRNTISTDDLWIVRRIFFAAASRAPAPDVVDVVGTCLTEIITEEDAQPLASIFNEVLAAIAYNSAWEDLTAFLLRYPQTLISPLVWWSFSKVGRAWSVQVKTLGRAQTYATIARQWPTIVRLIEMLPFDVNLADIENEEYSQIHASGLIGGLVEHCDDAGFLQDIAELLKESFGGKAAAEVQRLQAFAEVHVAPDKEQILRRLDPDLALAFRRIWGLPEPDDLLAQKGRRKGR